MNTGEVHFLKICSHIFMIFWRQIGEVILVPPKQEVERKSEWFCGVKFVHSNFKADWENSFEQKFAFSIVVFVHVRQFHFDFYCFFFFDFWIRFFSKRFSQSIHRSLKASIFLFEPNLSFYLVVFWSHSDFWHWFSVGFLIFWYDSFWKWLHHLYSILGPVFV